MVINMPTDNILEFRTGEIFGYKRLCNDDTKSTVFIRRKHEVPLLKILILVFLISLIFSLSGWVMWLVAINLLPHSDNNASLFVAFINSVEKNGTYSQYISHFKNFVKRNGRNYKSYEEISMRFENFINTLKTIGNYQSFQTNVVFGMTDFVDWSPHELERLVSRKQLGLNEMNKIKKFDSLELVNRPESFDWRTKNIVTEIKDQGQCGSCWAFSVVAVVESMLALHKNKTLVQLSEQQLVDCDINNSGCNGGYRPFAFEYVRDEGLVLENNYPYIAKENDDCLIDGGEYHIDNVNYIRPNEEEMANIVFSKGPISVGFNVTKELFYYKSGVFKPTEYDCVHKSVGSHAVAIVGYGTLNGEDYWLIKNSWGSRWGMNGYLYYIRGENACGIANVPVTASL